MRYSIFFFFLFALSLCIVIFLKNEYFDKKITDQKMDFFISTNMSFDSLVYRLDDMSNNMHPVSKIFFRKFLAQKRLEYWYKPGRYVLNDFSSLNDVVNKLRSRAQDPVNLTFNSMDNIAPLLSIMQSNLELDSIDMISYLDSINFPIDSLSLLLIPNTYELFWDISPENLFIRLQSEYKKFWNPDRLRAATINNLSEHEVFILASIVDKEASHVDEMAKIAGLYINRLKKNWALAADPTIVYIWRKNHGQQLRRIRNKHIEFTKDSKFNTYYHKGLPPLPICIPSFQAIESVLYPENHNFLYMCARPDNSEYHNFAVNHFEHQANAAAFHAWLNKRKIY